MAIKSEGLFVKVPLGLLERLKAQEKRLEASKSALVRMALVRFLEEEEAKERNNQ